NLDTGNYVISEEVQNGWIQTYPIGSTYSIRIDVSSTIITSQNFGNFQLASISGKKYTDLVGDSSITGDATLNNWKIKLFKSGVLQSSVLTSGSGDYAFNNLLPGIYTVEESLQTDWMQTYPRVSGAGVVLTTYGTNAGPRAYQITVTSGGNFNTRDFGNFHKVSIGGQKFHDLDGDGTKDAGELGLAGWKIRIAGSKNDSATTDVNGNYVFADLEPGSYTLSEDMQTGWMQTVAPTGTIVTSSGTNVVNKDFGNFQKVSISGQKYHDRDGDGIKDTGEEALANWKIRIAGAKVDSIFTDVNGNYTFINLGPGCYTLSEVAQSGWIQTSPANGLICVSSGTNVIDKDFGNYQMAIVSGMKFNDMNGDSIKNTGDIGLSGWKIRITGTKTDSATTDINGNYTISNLPKGNYTLTEVLQSGWKQTYPAGNSYSITVDASGTVITGKDFGNFKLATISGKKYNDTAGDSALTGDIGLNNWVIKLYKSGVYQMQTTTGLQGDYTFNNIDAGSYTIEENLNTGWVQTYPRVGSAGVVLTTYGGMAGPRAYAVNVNTSGTIITGKDFANFQLGSISGTKFNDLNGNGVKDAGDPHLSVWNIRLNGAKVDSVITDANGNYTFTNLGPGNYTLSEELQTGWIQTLGQPGVITMTSGATITSKNFGNFQVASISGKKYNDAVGDSLITSDVTLNNWVIKLYKSGVFQSSTITSGSGDYTFNNLIPGTYTVEESLETNWMQTYPRVGSAGVVLTTYGTNAGKRAYQVSVSSGTNSGNKDFGNFQRVSISGQKFHDRNGDGIKDAGEEGLSNWKIKIGGAKVDSIFTDVNGNYSFSNLGPGSYTLSEVLQNGWVQMTLPIAPIVVSSGTNVIDKDFGNYQMAIVSGMKFNDLNGYGVKEIEDLGLSGWKIRITGTKTDSATTDINGNYTISNLPKGSYTLTEVLQSGWKQTSPAGNSYSITVDASGTVITGKDFGNFKLATISGMKFNDLNGDSIKNTGELGLSGWKIRLTGAKIDSVLTDANGNYTFANLDTGNYVISEEVQNGWIQTYPIGSTYSIRID
ncbi:MAG: hypothetical protein HY964_05335, partial [Ignavibacteriales bacterium]|nr:hypothetical protein [Ignavibacteriales bacterium]